MTAVVIPLVVLLAAADCQYVILILLGRLAIGIFGDSECSIGQNMISCDNTLFIRAAYLLEFQ